MKNLIPILIISVFISCKTDKQENDNNQAAEAPNLICNSSFEINGKPSLNCWNIVKDFSTFPDTFSTDIPNSGGQFSLRLEGIKDAKWDPYAETYITNISGQRIISLSAYIKSLNGGQSIYLWLEHIRGGQTIRNKSYSNGAFNGWKKFNLTDTLTIQTQDSLRVKIIQNTGQNSSALIDLVQLTTN